MAVPFRVQQLAAGIDPADAFAALFGGPAVPDAVWLDSGSDARTGRSVLGTGTVVATASVAEGTATVGGRTTAGTILDALREDERLRGTGRSAASANSAAQSSDVQPSDVLGWMGWLGYESGVAALGLPVTVGPGPDAALLLVDRALVIEHDSGAARLVTTDEPAALRWAESAAELLSSCDGAAAAYERQHPIPPATAHWRHGDADYLRMILACQDAIRAGDAYQLCLTNTAEAVTEADPLAVHLRLRRASPAHHAGLVRIGGDALVSSSPEQFLRVTADGRVRTKPIKGTRPRGATVAADLALRAELEASEKERAENVMIVDLMRNDLGRVSEVGSVEVHNLLAVESYAQVHQLVTTVEGRLRLGLGALDALAACFPAGSMTGAPKLSALRILAGLERGPRGAYAGCFGILAHDGSADLAMVIRSLRFRDGRVSIGAGGGITALSVPEEELEEVRVKARALFTAAGIAPSASSTNPE